MCRNAWCRYGLLAGLVLLAMSLSSCVPITYTLYPLLTHRTARPVPPGKVRVQTTLGTASMVEAVPEDVAPSTIHLEQPSQWPEFQAGLLAGLSRRVDVAGDFLYGLAWGPASPGFRLSSRIRVTPEAAPVVVSLSPAVMFTWARDRNEDEEARPGLVDELSTSVLGGELRVPVTVPLNRLSDLTVAVGATYSHFHAAYEGWDHTIPAQKLASTKDRNHVGPLATLGFRVGVFSLEGGMHQVQDHWQSCIGLAVGWQ